MDAKTFFSTAKNKVRDNLPGVIRNFPYSSAVLLVVGIMVDRIFLFWI